MRGEIERAFNRASRRGEDGEIKRAPKFITYLVMLTSIVLAILGYSHMGNPGFPDIPLAKRAEYFRPSQEMAFERLAGMGAIAPASTPDAQTKSLLTQLEDIAANRPDELQAWIYLAQLSYSIQDYKRASEAQIEVLRLKTDQSDAQDHALLAENFILSVNGYVSPEAENALRRALEIDPQNQIARFYFAMLAKQEGEPVQAQNMLQALLGEGIENPDWRRAIEREILALNPARGPNAQDIANAQDMSVPERAAMIGSMVDGLKSRLASQGGTPDEWARLIHALRVLERDEEANMILAEARDKFPDNAEIQALK